MLLSGIVPEYRLSDVVWGPSNEVANAIVDSSLFIKELQSRNLTESSYNRFIEHDVRYRRGISHILEVRCNFISCRHSCSPENSDGYC